MLKRKMKMKSAVVGCLLGMGISQFAAAQACDGLTVSVYFAYADTGEIRYDCRAAAVFAHELQTLSSILVTSDLSQCDERGVVQVRLDPDFAPSSQIDSFDLAKRLWHMKARHPKIDRVEVCRQ